MFGGLVKGIAPAVAMEWANAIQQEKSRRKAFYESSWIGRAASLQRSNAVGRQNGCKSCVKKSDGRQGRCPYHAARAQERTRLLATWLPERLLLR